MAREILASKIRIPTRQRGLVLRPRLNALLGAGAAVRLTVVSAPAGFGKTTLLTDWLLGAAGEGRRLAWLSLDPHDSDPSAFWGAVVAALHTVAPGLAPTLPELVPAAPFPTELILTAVLKELAEEAQDIWLVLDDYHAVDGPGISDGMVFLVEHLPPHVHLVISTRADPLLPLPLWRVRGELAEIRAAELLFTPAEASAYLNDTAGLGLAPPELAVLGERTEGWIAALQLAALSLRGRTDPAAFIARFAGDDSFVLDYLVEEVLARQPGPVREFLLETSVLDRFTGQLCDAVTGTGGGSSMLLTLERANLFLIPLDGHREWHRYHQLFADVLRVHLLSEQPGLVPLLHQRASSWFQDQGLVEEAVRHALAATDFDAAAHLMELAAPAIRRNRQESLMRSWLAQLPEAVIRRSPVLGVFDAYMLMAAGQLDGVEPRLVEAERVIAAAALGTDSPWADVEEFQTIPATIAIYRASLAQARGDVAGTTAHARHALDLAGPGDHLARGAANGYLGLAAWVTGDVHAALQTFTLAVASLHAAGNLVDELSSTVLLADMWLAAGRPDLARGLLQDALLRARPHGGSVARATAELHVALGEIDCEAGDLAGARLHLDAAAGFFEHAPLVESRYRWFVGRALLADAEATPALALDFLGQAEPLYQPGFFPEVRPIAALRARFQISQGHVAEAADWACERGVFTTDAPSFLHEYNHLTLVRLMIAQHRAAMDPLDNPLVDSLGGPLLEQLLAAALASGRNGSVLEIRLLQALCHDVQGRHAQAVIAIGRVLTEAPAGSVRIFLNEGAPMLAMLRDAAALNTASHNAVDIRAARLLSLAETQGTATQPTQGPASFMAEIGAKSLLTEPLSDRELHVLRLLGSELGGPAIAVELFISYNTLRTHTKHIFAKLGVNGRRAAVRAARERGLL